MQQSTDLTIAVRATYFAAAALFRSSEETRYYLNGVCVERGRKGGGVNLLATDGHHGAMIRDVEGFAAWPRPDKLPKDAESDLSRIVRCPPDLLKHCKAKSKEWGNCTRWVVVKPATIYVVIASDAKEAVETIGDPARAELVLHASFGSSLIDASYPDFRRVTPPRKVARSKLAPCFGLNTSLLGNFSAAASLLSGDRDAHACVRAPVDGVGPIWVATTSPDLIGVLMPMRCHDEAAVLGMAKDILDAPIGKAPPRPVKPKRPKLITPPKVDDAATVAIAA